MTNTDTLTETMRAAIGPLLNEFGERQWQSGRGVAHKSLEEAFEAIIERAALAAPAQTEPEDLSVAYFMGLHAGNETLHFENEQLRAGYNAARLEIESLQAQAQQCGAGAGCCAQAARIEALQGQLEAVGAGGVGPLMGAPVGVVPFALLVRKKSWNEGQWECAPSGCPEYGRQWADERVWVYTAPQPAAQAQEDAVAQAVAAEREACAQVCESWADEHDYAGAIRARGTDAS